MARLVRLVAVLLLTLGLTAMQPQDDQVAAGGVPGAMAPGFPCFMDTQMIADYTHTDVSEWSDEGNGTIKHLTSNQVHIPMVPTDTRVYDPYGIGALPGEPYDGSSFWETCYPPTSGA